MLRSGGLAQDWDTGWGRCGPGPGVTATIHCWNAISFPKTEEYAVNA